MSSPMYVRTSAQTLLSHTQPTTAGQHPDYWFWSKQWQKIRHAILGEDAVKLYKEKYLKRRFGHDTSQYEAYLHRAVFYNMTAKTLNALVGTLFQRRIRAENIREDILKIFDSRGNSLSQFTKDIAYEITSVGRCGVLIDAPSNGGHNNAYAHVYSAEQILDWSCDVVGGEMIVTYILLEERDFTKEVYDTQYRVLQLNIDDYGRNYYEVLVYDGESGIPDGSTPPRETYIPMVRGRKLERIPFVFFGAMNNSPEISKPPLLDIVNLNFHHYENSAALEHGRFYTANPVYTVSASAGSGEAPAEYMVAPDCVWELGEQGKAGILEFSGNGLKSLESGMAEKESMVAKLGGRLIDPNIGSAGESTDALRMKEKNESTLLQNIADVLDEGVFKLIDMLSDWRGVIKADRDKIRFSLDRAFLVSGVDSKTIRAVMALYKEGTLPVDLFYQFLNRAELIDDMSIEEFRELLNSEDQFPNLIDVIAKQRGYGSAKIANEITGGTI